MKILVKGNHHVLGRGDKVFDDIEMAKEYEGGLIHFGYDNVEMVPKLSQDEIAELSKKVLPDVMMFGDDFAWCPICRKIQPIYTDWRSDGILKCEICEFILEA